MVELIPKKNGRELCLKFASQAGCKGKNGGCYFKDRDHFVPDEMPAEVAAIIVEKYGGLASAVKSDK